MMLTTGESPVWLVQQIGHSDLSMISTSYGRLIANAAPKSDDLALAMFSF